MQYPVRVRRGQRPRDVERDADDLRDGHPAPAPLHLGAQRPAGDELLDQVELRLEFLQREDGRDARMRERGGRHRLAPQPGAHPVVVGERRGQGLDGDRAPEPCVVTEVDDAHPAAAEEGGHFVGAEPPADHRVAGGVEQAGVRLHGRAVDDAGPAAKLEQRRHLGPQGLVAGARLGEEVVPAAGVAFERRVEQIVDPAPAFSVHRRRHR